MFFDTESVSKRMSELFLTSVLINMKDNWWSREKVQYMSLFNNIIWRYNSPDRRYSRPLTANFAWFNWRLTVKIFSFWRLTVTFLTVWRLTPLRPSEWGELCGSLRRRESPLVQETGELKQGRRTATGTPMQLFLACSDLNQSVAKPLF